MRLIPLTLVALLTAVSAAAQAGNPSPAGAGQPAAVQGGDRPATQPVSDLPVSLDRIREGLKKQAIDSLLIRPEIPADFRIQVLEQQKIDDMLSKLDFKSLRAPAPAGGLYGYEQQRRLFNPIERPLAQPYAAFSGGELITIAIENLIARYLGNRLASGIAEAEQARAEREARDEVAREIAAYCATRPDRASITICTLPPDR